MAIIRKDPQPIPGTSRAVIEEIVGNGETGNWIQVKGESFTVSVFPLGTAKVQYTTSRLKKVEASPPVARALDWALGNVTGAISAFLTGPIVAVRVVSIAGEAAIEVVT